MACTIPFASVTTVNAEEVTTGTVHLNSEPAIDHTPTPEQIEEIHEYLGEEVLSEIYRSQVEANNGKRALPGIAGFAIAAAAWCASGALSSIPTSALADIVNRGEGGGDYVRNAVYGCVAGNIGSAVWKFIPSSIKQKVLNAVVKFYLDHIRK